MVWCAARRSAASACVPTRRPGRSSLAFAPGAAHIDQTAVRVERQKPPLTVELVSGLLDNDQTQRLCLGEDGIHVWNNEGDIHARGCVLKACWHQRMGSVNDAELQFMVGGATQLHIPHTSRCRSSLQTPAARHRNPGFRSNGRNRCWSGFARTTCGHL